MFRIRPDRLIENTDGDLVGVTVDTSITALGMGSQRDAVIFRLFHSDWPSHGGLVPRDRVHQFVLTARQAGELGRRLLELEAQAQKDNRPPDH